jgi:general secretion pathway protein C
LNGFRPEKSQHEVDVKKICATGLFIFAAFLSADLLTLWSREYMFPKQAPATKPKMQNSNFQQTNYQAIKSRNIFNSTGQDPAPLIALQKNNTQQELPPILSQLPITLMGTLVHSNPEKSLASLEIRGKNQILSYRVKQEIDTLATLEKVERMKIFIRNKSSGRLEYIEMKNMFKMSIKSGAKSEIKGDVKKISDTEFEIKRSDLLKYTSDLSSVLMQARVVPARRGGSGEIYGYRLVEMQANSIYSQLGLQVGDVLTGVNGTPVTSAQQAMELYSNLRNAPSIKIQSERNGQIVDLSYKITN